VSAKASTRSRVFSAASLVGLLLAACGAHAAVDDAFPRAAKAYLVKRDGRLLWAGHADERLPPASLTKMMTALIVLESGVLDQTVVVSRRATREPGSRVGLKPGENFRARDLFAAMIMRSANDACRALADHLSPNFIALMNQRSAALGLRDTHFLDPCGHDRSGQYSTAADLARLAERVMVYEDYARLARQADFRISTLDGKRKLYFTNTNALIGRYEGALGVKTGSTSRAGNCLVALAEKDGSRVLIVMLNAPNRWWNAVGLFDRAFKAAAPLQ
jgi:D-alanyl-D-alanine carboxypeptidase (penicillin-binding protein 5/6)